MNCRCNSLNTKVTRMKQKKSKAFLYQINNIKVTRPAFPGDTYKCFRKSKLLYESEDSQECYIFCKTTLMYLPRKTRKHLAPDGIARATVYKVVDTEPDSLAMERVTYEKKLDEPGLWGQVVINLKK